MEAVEDIRINWDLGLMKGDFAFDESTNDLEKDSGLETAVIISLFTDRRANADDPLPDPNNIDLRGWWGDLASPIVEGDQIGSRLWLLSREKTEESVLRKAEEYAYESLQWMIDDGVAIKVDVQAERLGPIESAKLGLLVQIYKVDGNKEALTFDVQWAQQALR